MAREGSVLCQSSGGMESILVAFVSLPVLLFSLYTELLGRSGLPIGMCQRLLKLHKKDSMGH